MLSRGRAERDPEPNAVSDNTYLFAKFDLCKRSREERPRNERAHALAGYCIGVKTATIPKWPIGRLYDGVLYHLILFSFENLSCSTL